MLINKDCIIHPLPDYINRIAQHLPYRSRAIKRQLFPATAESGKKTTTPFTSHPKNVNTIVSLIQEADVLPYSENNPGLHNKFTNKVANAPEPSTNRARRVSAVMLKNPSVHAPNRKRRLQTLSDKKVSKSSPSNWKGTSDLSLQKNFFSKDRKTSRPTWRATDRMPLALCDSTDTPIKGQKSYATQFIQCRQKRSV